MTKIEIRHETENQFLAILALHVEMFDVLQIKPEYLSEISNRNFLLAMKKSYENRGSLTPAEMLAIDSESLSKLSELYQTQLVTSNYKKEFFILQEEIFSYYKEDIIEKYNSKLVSGEINYDKFIKVIDKLQSMQMATTTSALTKKELIDNITTDTKEIIINNFPQLSEKLKLVQGDFLIVGATTGVGKSGLLLNFMNDLMDRYQCIYFNMEMSVSTIYKRILSIKSDIPLSCLNKPTTYQQELIEKASLEIENNNVYIEHKSTDITAIKAKIKQLKVSDKHTIVFLDHLGLIRTDKKSLYEQATEVSKQLRQICLEYDCTIIAACQLNRSAYGNDEITLSMLKDSGELENSASKVILMKREPKENKNNLEATMHLEIAKNRDGQLTTIDTKYDKTKQIFKEKY